MVTDATDAALRDLRRRVVDPIVASVLTPDEVASVLVFRRVDQPDICARVTAANGEVSEHFLWYEPIPPADLTEIAAAFACQLEDFVAESRFGWGQQRTARYEIPPSERAADNATDD